MSAPAMSWDSVIYLVEMTWPFLFMALAIGVWVGWRSYRPDQ
jgi:hypothetical protein